MRGPNFRLRARLPSVGRRIGILFCLAAIVCIALLFWRQYDRLLREYAEIWCGDMTARSVNTAILAEAQQTEQLAELLTDADGQLTAIRVDAGKASRLKAATALAISENLARLSKSDSTVPLGTILGSRLFLGRGPLVRFRFSPVGNAQVELLSRFTDAGVNQTCHQLVLEVDITVSVMLPGAVVYRHLTQEAILSETVIVGKIPQVYLGAQ